MARGLLDKTITAIDVGTTKISVFVARYTHNEIIDIIGTGTVPSHGLSKGVVIDVPQAVRSIAAAVKEAELLAGIQIESAYVGVSGAHITSCNSHGVVPIKKGEITQEDINTVLAAAQAIPIPEGQQIIHVLPQYFTVDGRDSVVDPLGMHGIRLEVQAHIVIGSVSSVQNLVRCCERAGVQVRDVILEQLASADAVLTTDECALGVGVLDIGGGTADFAVFHKDGIRHTKVIPIAGNHFTNDLALGLRTPRIDAENIKKTIGIAHPSLLNNHTHAEISIVGNNHTKVVYQSELLPILEARARELISFVHEEIITYKLQPFLGMGIVITGGGSLLAGIDQITQEICHLVVRTGLPRYTVSVPEFFKTPIYATGYGLLVHALKKQRIQHDKSTHTSFVVRVVDHMRSWMREFF
jgi:cell division protein FtsA